jgi:UDP-glucose 4-epimerase
MKRILVTGGTGYIGSHACVALLTQGFEVAVIDNLRYLNPVGAHESGQMGENPQGIPNNLRSTSNRSCP